MRFEYVWYTDGKYLAKWKGGDRPHMINTVPDLTTYMYRSQMGTMHLLDSPLPFLINSPYRPLVDVEHSTAQSISQNPTSSPSQEQSIATSTVHPSTISTWLTSPDSSESSSSAALKASSLNAASLKKHIWEFWQALINNSSYHLFGIAEPRLGLEVTDSHVSIPGYSTIRQNRTSSGIGVCLYIEDNLNARVLHPSKTTKLGKPMKPEYLFCKLWEKASVPVLVVLVYKPPDVPIISDRKLISLLRSAGCSHKI